MSLIAMKDSDQYMLRLPPGLRDKIKQLADSNGRSTNTEIIAAIERAVENGDRLTQIEQRLAKLEGAK